MSLSESLNGGFSVMLITASLIASFFLPPEVSTFLLAVAYTTVVYALGIMLGNDDGRVSRAISYFVKVVVATILIYAIIYWRYGLMHNGKHVDITPLESFYFSVTTWTTLGYGDFSPPPRIRHITSIQAIMGYLGLGIWIGLIHGLMGDLKSMRQDIRAHNKKLKDSDEE